MTALPVAPSCFRFRILGKVNTMNLAHIMHAQYAGATPSATDCTTIALGLRSAFNTRFAGLIGNNVTYNTFEVLDLATLTGAVGTNTTAVTGGTTPSTGNPNSACIVVSWKISLRYRGGHPRTYFPFPTTSLLTGGNAIPSTTVTQWQTAGTNFITDINALTSGPLSIAFATVSYFHNKVMRPTGQPYLISAAQVHSRLDTQRRRLGKEF